MKKRVFFSNLRLSLFIIGLLIASWGSVFNMPVYAVGPHLKINVTPSNISFNIVDAEEPEEFYSGNQEVVVVSQHTVPMELKFIWHLMIRAADEYLIDSINPDNKIPVSRLHWSKDGSRFQQLSKEWAWVNSYFDFYNKPYEETITYRLYPEPGQSLPAGLYSVRIEFDARWIIFHWR